MYAGSWCAIAACAILEEMMAERGICVDHFTIHRWIVQFSPRLLERFNRRKRAVTGKWRMDETYIKVRGRWVYIYRAIDSVGDSVELLFSEQRDLLAGMSSTRTSSCMDGPSLNTAYSVGPSTKRVGRWLG